MSAVEPPLVFTVGHSNHEFDSFMRLLRLNGIDTLVDIRYLPRSKYQPQFCRESMELAMHGSGIDYVYLGKNLGGFGMLTKTFKEVAVDPDFKSGIVEIAGMAASGKRVAMMCAERHPMDCHRGLVVSWALAVDGFDSFPVEVRHILEDGTTVDSVELLNALMSVKGYPAMPFPVPFTGKYVSDCLEACQVRWFEICRYNRGWNEMHHG